MGYLGTNASFSAELKTLSKLSILAMQIRGRHRGLPYELDRAILPPPESLQKTELQDAERRMRRRGSNLSNISALNGPTHFANSRAETGTASARRTDVRPACLSTRSYDLPAGHRNSRV